MKRFSFYFVMIMAVASIAMAGSVMAQGNGKGRPFHQGLIYVTSHGLYYDTIVPIAPDKGVSMNGPFQELRIPASVPGAIAETDFGPGDSGYVGGRWWIDNGMDDHTGNGTMDPDDTYFICPLLGPGMPYMP